MTDPLRDFCTTNAIPWNADRADQFTEYLDLLLQFNDSMNLIGPMSRSEIVDTLLIDSLAAAVLRPPDGPILDVGTGAGLPGIPLQIAYPGCPTTLVEPRKKRHTFLKIARQRLGLDDLTLERARLEELDPAELGRFDYVISKAFRAPSEWVDLAARWRADDDAIVCLTRPAERPAIAEAAAEHDLQIVASCDDTTELEAPALEEKRAIYVISGGAAKQRSGQA